MKVTINWEAKIALLSQQQAVELMGQIFEMLCLYNVQEQSLFRTTILSALAGNMVSKLQLRIARLSNEPL